MQENKVSYRQIVIFLFCVVIAISVGISIIVDANFFIVLFSVSCAFVFTWFSALLSMSNPTQQTIDTIWFVASLIATLIFIYIGINGGI